MTYQDLRSSPAAIVAAALIASTVIGGLFYRSARTSTDTLSVTGSAKTSVTSDVAKISIGVSKTIPQSQLGAGYAQMSRDAEAVRSFLLRQGAEEKSIVVTPVSSMQQYDGNNVFAGDPRYQLSQAVEYQSGDVAKVTELSKSVTSLSNQGIVVAINSVEYYYSKLAELRVALLGEAVKDAQARAAKIAESSGRRVGPVKSASSGVVQVLPVNSVDIADEGMYDTAHVEKQVMVTVKASFGIR